MTAKLRFLAGCSYIPQSAQGAARQTQQLEQALRDGQDAAALWAGIQHHRVFALAERVLRAHDMLHVLGDAQSALQGRARQARMKNVRFLAAAVQLSASLTAAAIPHHFLKGPLLS